MSQPQPSPPAIAVPSARDVRQAERQRAAVPNYFRPQGLVGGAAQAAGRAGQQVQELGREPPEFLLGPGPASAGSAGQHGAQGQPSQARLPVPQGSQGLPPAAALQQQQQQPPPSGAGGANSRHAVPMSAHLLQPSLPPPAGGGHPPAHQASGALFQQQQQQQGHNVQHAAQQPFPANAIIVNRRQEGNPGKLPPLLAAAVAVANCLPPFSAPHSHALITHASCAVLKYIRNVRWQFGDIVPDYMLGRDTACLYLSLRFHMLKPEYIFNRIKELQRSFRLAGALSGSVPRPRSDGREGGEAGGQQGNTGMDVVRLRLAACTGPRHSRCADLVLQAACYPVPCGH